MFTFTWEYWYNRKSKGGEIMGLFSKKQKIDYDRLFKEQYKSINQLTIQAQEEMDFVIKESLFEVVVQKYNELFDYIDKGAQFEKAHFESLQVNAMNELQKVKNINQDLL